MTELTTIATMATFRKKIPPGRKVEGGRFLDFLDEHGFEIGDVNGWQAYLADLEKVQREGKMKGRKYAAGTRVKYISTMCSMLKSIADHPDMPVGLRYKVERELDKIKRPKPKKPRAKFLTKDQVLRLMRECPEEDTRLMVEFLFFTAMRVSEMTGLTLAAIQRKNERFMEATFTGKGGLERRVPIEIDLYNRVRHHFKGKVYLFEKPNMPEDTEPEDLQYSRQVVTMRVRRWAIRILGREIGAHVLRHSFLTLFYKTTNDVLETSKMAGHKSPTTTSLYYVHTDLRLENVEKVIDAVYQN